MREDGIPISVREDGVPISVREDGVTTHCCVYVDLFLNVESSEALGHSLCDLFT